MYLLGNVVVSMLQLKLYDRGGNFGEFGKSQEKLSFRKINYRKYLAHVNLMVCMVLLKYFY